MQFHILSGCVHGFCARTFPLSPFPKQQNTNISACTDIIRDEHGSEKRITGQMPCLFRSHPLRAELLAGGEQMHASRQTHNTIQEE